jgi:hypothetical protein
MQDNKLIEDARSLTTVIASGTVDLSYEQIRNSFLKVVPALIAEVEILNAMKELKLELKKPRKPRRKKAVKKK